MRIKDCLMTDLQKVRQMLMKQLEKIDNNQSSQKEIDSVVSISNSIVKSLNVEVRADELQANKDIKSYKATFLNTPKLRPYLKRWYEIDTI